MYGYKFDPTRNPTSGNITELSKVVDLSVKKRFPKEMNKR